MKVIFKKLFVVALAAIPSAAMAQGPNNTGSYYKAADGKSGAKLKTALSSCVSDHVERSYKQLWDDFRTTDRRDDGKVWDMYSGVTNFTFGTDQAGNYKAEGDVYNREHSVPKSWFDDAKPMYTDLHHLVPTDGYVNNRRGNYPFGEVGKVTYESEKGFSKLGSSTTEGYNGVVFEPNDEYKGDFARIYFYMATCYENRVSTWTGGMFGNGSYPGLSGWAVKMLLQWAKDDPVSEKEINRNNAVYGIQKNRNPYVDYPGLEQYVWGSLTSKAFSYDHYSDPSASIGSIGTNKQARSVRVYSISGVLVRQGNDRAKALSGLSKGIYIVGGKKFVVN